MGVFSFVVGEKNVVNVLESETKLLKSEKGSFNLNLNQGPVPRSNSTKKVRLLSVSLTQSYKDLRALSQTAKRSLAYLAYLLHGTGPLSLSLSHTHRQACVHQCPHSLEGQLCLLDTVCVSV